MPTPDRRSRTIDSRYGGTTSAVAAVTSSLGSLIATFFTSLLPPPRTAVTLRSAAPLIFFVLTFLLTCFLLDRSDTIIFTRLWPFGFILTAPWFWWMHQAGYANLSKGRALIALIARFILLGLFIIALAEPRAVRKDEGLSIVFVVDTSASIRPEARDEALRFIARITKGKPQDDHAGLIFFGRSAAVELPPSASLPLDEKNPAMNVQIDYDGTDIAKALSLAAAMLPKEKNGRIVLISDGVETDGQLAAALDDLKSKGIPVDVMPVVYEYEDEVWLEHLELPRAVKIGEDYNATVILSSLKKGKGKLRLLENGQPYFEDEVAFEAGKNRYTVPIRLREAGYYEYTAHIEVADEKDPAGKVVLVRDNKKENNKAINHLYLRGKGKVLVVTDSTGDPRDFNRLVESLITAGREVETLSALEFARDAAALLPYDCIIFANVPASMFDAQQMEAVHEAVFAQGSGFLMVGGANSFGPGGYHKTAVEKALPVSMDITSRKFLPSGALVILVDRSGSMTGTFDGTTRSKQAVANEAAVAAAKTLFPRDWLGVASFDTDPQWVVPLKQIENPDGASKQIRMISTGGGTNMYPALDAAIAELNKLPKDEVAIKHIILLTDGESMPGNDAHIVAKCLDGSITLSTVGVGNDANHAVLAPLSRATGGTHYPVNDPKMLPRVFIKEAMTLRRSMIQNVTFTPTSLVPHPSLDGIESLPALNGYVLTSPKPKSQVVLRGPIEEELDPVLSVWRYGIGASAAWTSDLSANWAANWVQWPKYDAFVKQLVTSISRASDDSTLRVRSFVAGGQGVLIVEDFGEKDTFMVIESQIQGPRGLDVNVPLKQVGPNRYEGKFPLTGEGTYKIMAAGAGSDGKTQRVHSRLVMPYSQEYMQFRSKPMVLADIARKSGGRILTGSDAEDGKFIYTSDRTAKASSLPIVDWVLILLACMIPIDVGLRRVQVDMDVIRSMFFLGRREQPSAATFSKLRAKKETVTSGLADRARMKTPAREEPAMKIEIGKPVEVAMNVKREEAAEKTEEPVSSTSRLLAAKKRAQEKQ